MATLCRRESGRIVLPLNNLGYFLRADGSRGSFAALLKALASAQIAGLDPVEIVASDLTAPISARPKLRLKVSDVLNRPIKGKLTVKIPGLVVEPEEQTICAPGPGNRRNDSYSRRRPGSTRQQL